LEDTELSLSSEVALALFHSGALKFGEFRLKSGVVSPYYVDLTWLLSSPGDFSCVVDAAAEEIRKVTASTKVDKLASIELKGALLLPSIAGKLNLPCFVVRKQEKEYGVTGRIAGGNVTRGDRILFFDDVVTDAESKLEGVKPLELLGARIEVIMVVVDREQGGRERLEKLGYSFHSLTTISKLVSDLQRSKQLSQRQAETVLNYVQSARQERRTKLS